MIGCNGHSVVESVPGRISSSQATWLAPILRPRKDRSRLRQQSLIASQIQGGFASFSGNREAQGESQGVEHRWRSATPESHPGALFESDLKGFIFARVGMRFRAARRSSGQDARAARDGCFAIYDGGAMGAAFALFAVGPEAHRAIWPVGHLSKQRP